MIRLFAAVVIMSQALVLSACGQAEQTEDLCSQAEDRLRTCGQDSQILFVDGCDADLAKEILDADCALLANPGKSDLMGDLLCRTGLYRYCVVPECTSALPAGFHDWGDCAELIVQDGCAACDYYRCREETSIRACGDDGYYLGFGYKYCLRYRQVTEPKLSPEGQAWSARTRQCLMETLENEVADTGDCAGLVDAGYDSHPACYVGTGFCDLPGSDWAKVAATIDFSDIDFSLFLQTRADCSEP